MMRPEGSEAPRGSPKVAHLDLFELLSHSDYSYGVAERSDFERAIFSSHARLVFSSVFRESCGMKSTLVRAMEIFLDGWSNQDRFFPWTRSFGHLWMKSLAPGQPLPIDALLETVLNASISGVGSKFDFALEDPVSIMLGSYYFENVIAGNICTDEYGSTGELRFASGKECTFSTAPLTKTIKLNTDEFSTRFSTHELLPGASLTLVPPSAVSNTMLPQHACAAFLPFGEHVGANPRIRNSIEILKAVPASLSWVASVVREIVPITNFEGIAASSSSPWECGTVALTAAADPLLIAEMLVHEASHQHFFIAKHLGPMDDGTDRNHYHSPMVNNTRPLEKILLAFHALGNMAIFHSEILLVAYQNADLSRQRLVEISRRINMIRPILDRSPALNCLGRAIYQPLANRLDTIFSQQQTA